MWHDVNKVFYSLSALKLQLIDSFSEELPSSMDFQVSYFEGSSPAVAGCEFRCTICGQTVDEDHAAMCMLRQLREMDTHLVQWWNES